MPTQNRVFSVMLLALLPFAWSGCASVRLIVHSDPDYATIYSRRGNFGKTPTVLTYRISKEARLEGKFAIGKLTARWISGATKQVRMEIPVGKGHSTTQEFTVLRPDSAPNLELDVKYAQEMAIKRIHMQVK